MNVTPQGTRMRLYFIETDIIKNIFMEESRYDEIIKRLERIENLLKPLEEDTSYGKKILANILGNVIWEWLAFGTRDTGLHPPC